MTASDQRKKKIKCINCSKADISLTELTQRLDSCHVRFDLQKNSTVSSVLGAFREYRSAD